MAWVVEGMTPLYAFLAEPDRARSLLKARALLDVAHVRDTVGVQLAALGLSRELRRHIWKLAAPVYLKGRVAAKVDQALPRVEVVQSDGEEDDERLVACVKYALGLEGVGVVLFDGQKPTVGMVKDVFVELCELLVPEWDREEEDEDDMDEDGGY